MGVNSVRILSDVNKTVSAVTPRPKTGITTLKGNMRNDALV